MNCKKCGKALKPDDKFCSGCGTPVEHKEIFFAEVGLDSEGKADEYRAENRGEVNKRKKFQVETFHWDLEGFPKTESVKENKNYGLDDDRDFEKEEAPVAKKSESVLFDWSEVVEPKKKEAGPADFKWNNEDFPTGKKNGAEERPARFDWGLGNTTRFDRIPLTANGDKEIIPSEDNNLYEESESRLYTENFKSPFDELNEDNGVNVEKQEEPNAANYAAHSNFVPPIAKPEKTGRPIVVNSFEDLESDVKGINETEARKIDKFYTFNQKNEEFQALLDQEYERLRRRLREESEQEARLQERSKALEEVRKNWDMEDIRIKREDEVDVQLEATPLSDLDKISMGQFNLQGLNNKKTPLDDIIAVTENLTAEKEAIADKALKSDDEDVIIEDAIAKNTDANLEDKASDENIASGDEENEEIDEVILPSEEDAPQEENDESNQGEDDAEEVEEAKGEKVEKDVEKGEDIETKDEEFSMGEETEVADKDNEKENKKEEKEEEAAGKTSKEKVSHGAETMQLERIIVDDLEQPIEPMESTYDEPKSDEIEVQDEIAKGASDESNLLFVGKPAEVTLVDETKDSKPNKKLATTATYVGIFTDDDDLATGKKKRSEKKRRKEEEKRRRESTSGSKPKKKSKSFIWDILILILTCIVIIMAVGAFAPDSFIGQKINAQFNNVVNMIKGDDSKAENQRNAEKDMSPTDKAIKNRSNLNKNIAYVVGNPGLKIDVSKDYGMEDLRESTTFKDSQWYSDEKGKSVSYLEAVVGTLMTYYSDYSDFISKGSENVYKSVVDNSQANRYLNSISGGEKGFKISRLDIGEIRNSGDHYFVITNIKTTSAENSNEKSEMNVIDLIKDGKTLKVNGIYSE